MRIEDEALLAQLSEDERIVWSTLSPEDQESVRASFTQHIPATEELRELTRQLYRRARNGDGRILHRQKLEDAKVHECANNAVAWVEAHPGDRVAYGFLFIHFDYRFRHVRFTPHVGVLTNDGNWLDVTPHESFIDHPFLQHAGTDEEFQTSFNNGPMDLIYR